MWPRISAASANWANGCSWLGQQAGEQEPCVQHCLGEETELCAEQGSNSLYSYKEKKQMLPGMQSHACSFLNSCIDEMKGAAQTNPKGSCSIAYSQRHFGWERGWKWLGATGEPHTMLTSPSSPKACLPSPHTQRFLY